MRKTLVGQKGREIVVLSSVSSAQTHARTIYDIEFTARKDVSISFVAGPQ